MFKSNTHRPGWECYKKIFNNVIQNTISALETKLLNIR